MKLFRDIFRWLFNSGKGKHIDTYINVSNIIGGKTTGGNFAQYGGRGSGTFKKNQRVERKLRAKRNARKQGRV